jgi:protein required for attachment to host cells
MKPIRSWIVIADGARARILENTGPGKGLTALPAEEMHHIHPPSRDIVADRPGRSHDRMGPQRHAMEPPSDAHREEKRRFADELAELLNTAARMDSYDRLVLVAPAKTLGDLRQALGKEAAAKVDGELSKDLTPIADHELPDHLDSVITV